MKHTALVFIVCALALPPSHRQVYQQLIAFIAKTYPGHQVYFMEPPYFEGLEENGWVRTPVLFLNRRIYLKKEREGA